MSIILSLYPNFFGYSLEGYSHRERCRAPDRKKSTEEGWEVAMKNQLVDKWFRNNRLHFVNNELRLYCRQNKDRLLPSGAIYEELKRITQLFWILKQLNKAATYDSRVVSLRQNLNVVVEIYHEGKTQDPSCVARYMHMENHWDSFFVSPKCGIRMDLTGFPNSNPRWLNLK
jgi:hypothetical protein